MEEKTMKERDRMKILIAYDGSECAESAIDDLKRAGLPRRAEAIPPSFFPIPGQVVRTSRPFRHCFELLPEQKTE